MYRELRQWIAGFHAARLLPNGLAEFVVVVQGGCRDGVFGQRTQETQGLEFVHRMGQQVDAYA